MLRQKKSVQTAVNIAMLLIKSKIMTTSVNGLTINDMEKDSAISINNTPNNRKHQILNDATPMFQP